MTERGKTEQGNSRQNAGERKCVTAATGSCLAPWTAAASRRCFALGCAIHMTLFIPATKLAAQRMANLRCGKEECFLMNSQFYLEDIFYLL